MDPLRTALQTLLTSLLLVFFTAASAQDAAYPSRPVKLVVPYPPGGPTDIVARLMGQKLGERIGQPVIVENVGGANGNIGSAAVARAEPDGYTLLLGSSGPVTINPSLYPKMGYNPATDLRPVAVVAQLPLAVVVPHHMKVNSIGELIAFAKANPGKLAFASAGNGSTQHLAGELLKSIAKIDMRHIPYKGAAPAMTDLLAGRVDLMIELMPTALPQIAAGKLKPLAVATMKRLPKLPDVPTLHELGLEGYEVVSWFGIMAPVGVPKPIVAKLHEVLTQITRDSLTREQLAARGIDPAESSLQDFDVRITTDIAKWSRVVKSANVQVD